MKVMIVALVGLLMLSTTAVLAKASRTQVGSATTFHPIEKGLNNGILACTGKKWRDESLHFCAHRTIKCGTWITVENVRTGMHTICKIMDRGPYGKRDVNGKWFNAATDRKRAKKEGRPPKKGKYISILDMSQAVSDILGSKGRIKVEIVW